MGQVWNALNVQAMFADSGSTFDRVALASFLFPALSRPYIPQEVTTIKALRRTTTGAVTANNTQDSIHEVFGSWERLGLEPFPRESWRGL